MKSFLRKLFRLLLLGLFVILGIIIVKTLSFSSKQNQVKQIEKIEINAAVETRFSSVLKLATISYPSHVDTGMFEQLLQHIDSNYLLVDSILDKEVINKFSLIYKWHGKNSKLKPILLMGHTDVIPIEEQSLDSWIEKPFSGEIKDAYIWGRGTLDDKLNVFGILEAIEAMLKENYQPNRTIYLAFGHDEEVGGRNGAKAQVEWFKKRGIDFEYILDEGSIILEKALPGLAAPAALIGIAEKGYTTLALSVNLKNGGHSSMPLKETAIGILSKALSTLEANPFPAKIDGATRKLLEYTGPEMNTMYKAIFANLWLFEPLLKKQFSKSPVSNAVLRTTTAITMIRGGIRENVLPSTASAKINFRILPGETVNTVVDYVRKTIDTDKVIVNRPKKASFSSNPSKLSDINSFGYNVIQNTIQELFPAVVVAPSLVVAGTDSRHYEDLSDNIFRFTPMQLGNIDLKRIHGINERISIENYKQVIRFYRRLIENSCK